MAAYAALLSLAHTTDLLLNSDKYSISVDEKAQITSIREYAMFLISFLEDFPDKSSRLEGKIRDLANQTEVIIEDFMWKQIRLNWCSIQRLSRFAFDEQLTKLRVEIGLIVGQTMDERLVGDSSATISSSRLAPTNNNDVVIGLGDDLITIKDRLCGASSKLQFIPITGMGGIGKTTLARNAYDDSSIVGYFHIRAWITVSQHYSARRILSSLLDSMNLFLKEQVLGEEIDETVMAEKVYKCLKGRRYLVVMDDVWSTEVLDDVRKLFPDDGNGSRIMLTTRQSNVSLYADSSSPLHQMRFMDMDQSWDLLKQKVFVAGQDCPSELEDIGKMIARSCGGLPLAVVLVGGILSASKMTRASWMEVAQNITSIVDEQLEKLLSLCYKHLPQHLRPCFLLIGGFSEDYEIQVSRLIKLWVAQGFLKRGNRYKSFEDDAEEYLEDLVRRNLVLVAERKTNGKIKRCKLHDLVRDLCISKSDEEKLLRHVNERYTSPVFIKNFCYINHVDHYLKETWGPTFLAMLNQRVATSLRLDLVGNFRLLRILDMINDSGRLLPSQVFELFHLRYLALAFYVEIPPSISNLENLQTLIICPWRKYGRYPAYFSSLPLEIWSIPQLRHLVFSYSYILPDPEDGSTLPLENLQTLSGVASLVCSKRVMKLIPNLKKLGIIYSRNEDYNLYNLIHLHQLENLKITRCQDSSWLRKNPIFPPTLKKLTLYGGEFPWKDMAVVGDLPNLEVLKLKFLVYDGDTWETTNGGFLQLKFLLIEESNLQYWITETNHFPRLKSLRLHRCWDLSRIPDGIGEIPTLELIEVDDVNKSLVDSAKQILEDQLEYYGNNALQVHCIHFKEMGKARRSWSPEEKRALVDALKFSIIKGWRGKNGFRTGHHLFLEKQMEVAIPGITLVAEPHIKLMVYMWKRQYGFLSGLLSKSGVHWNPIQKKVECTKESWDEECKAYEPMMNKMDDPWPFYEDWVEIFGKDKDTGDNSINFGEAANGVLNNSVNKALNNDIVNKVLNNNAEFSKMDDPWPFNKDWVETFGKDRATGDNSINFCEGVNEVLNNAMNEAVNNDYCE